MREEKIHMVSLDIRHPFTKLLIVFTLWIAWSLLSGGLFEVYLAGQGITLQQIFYTNIGWFLPPLLILPFIRKLSLRSSVLLGIIIAFSATFLFLVSPPEYSGYIYRLLLGFAIVFFWVPFNIAYYEFRHDNHAQMGALYYSVTPMLSLFLPFFSGYVASIFGFPVLFVLSMFAALITFIAAFILLEEREYQFDLVTSLRQISGLRTLVFTEGFTASLIIGTTLSILLLNYASQPFEFGIFSSLSMLFSIAASMLTAKLSDKKMERRSFLLPMVVGFAISTMVAGLTHDVLVFFIAMGMVNFFSRIFFPLPLALVVDNSKSIVSSMVGREFMLNLGRIAGVMVGIILVQVADLNVVMMVEGAALLLYIPIFENRKNKLLYH